MTHGVCVTTFIPPLPSCVLTVIGTKDLECYPSFSPCQSLPCVICLYLVQSIIVHVSSFCFRLIPYPYLSRPPLSPCSVYKIYSESPFRRDSSTITSDPFSNWSLRLCDVLSETLKLPVISVSSPPPLFTSPNLYIQLS